jgi:8-oxo-dGTP diphosphatase
MTLPVGQKDKVKVIMPAAGGVIYKIQDNQKYILIIQRSASDHWALMWEYPRGKCDKKGETILDCLKREIKEETGLDVKVEKFLTMFSYIADKGTRFTRCYNYLCQVVDPNQEVRLSKEHQDFRWIGTVGEAELLLHPDQKRVVAQILNPEKSIVNYVNTKADKILSE